MPFRDCVKYVINCFSWAGGSPYFKRSSAEFSAEFKEIDFISFIHLVDG